MRPDWDKIKIFTDGSSSYKDGSGAWAFRLIWKDEVRKEKMGPKWNTTVNEMELTAILEAIKTLKCNVKRSYMATIYSDSQYCVNVLTKWWPRWERNNWITATGKPVGNKELIQEIIAAKNIRTSLGHAIRFRWVRGHNGNEHNERADQLAGSARRSLVKIGR